MSDWGEIDRMRRLVPADVDRHLENWAGWIRAYRVARGYSKRASVLSNGGVSQGFDDLCLEVDQMAAAIADAVIDELPIHHRVAISLIYVSDHPRLSRSVETDLLAGVSEFWRRALRRGLV